MTILLLITSSPPRFGGKGFTLIELIVVILLLGILAVSIGSRFDSSGYSEYTYQARLISALRNLQQRAMQDTRPGYCFRVNFDLDPAASAFGPPALNYADNTQAERDATCSSNIDDTSPEYLRTTSTEMAKDGVAMQTLTSTSSTFTLMQFDSLGRPLTDTDIDSAGLLLPNPDSCHNGCKVKFTGEQQVLVCIEAEGYIHAC